MVMKIWEVIKLLDGGSWFENINIEQVIRF